MIAVTGSAGFIGTRLVARLRARGRQVLEVELPRRMSTARSGCAWTAGAFRDALAADDRRLDALAAVVHLGAISDTLYPDDAELLANNYRYARDLMDAALRRGHRFSYASSAAVYGTRAASTESVANEQPLNVYGHSKWLLDRHARRHLDAGAGRLLGVRPFNVYGPGEAHKGRMASAVHRFDAQLAHHGVARLFGAAEGCAAGEQRRDFVHVDDLCAVLEWSLEQPDVAGLLNVGSGESTSFNAVAAALIAARGGGRIEYIDFPDALRGRYQAATCADLRQLRAAGFRGIPRRVTEAIAAGWRETPAGAAA